jgi:transcriptional regulator with XRE-family HTH domain
MESLLDRKLNEARKRRSLPAPHVRRLLRLNAGLTQKDIAQIVGIGRPTVTRWEAGMREPQGRNALAYAELLERLAQEALKDGSPAAPGFRRSSAEEGGGDVAAA